MSVIDVTIAMSGNIPVASPDPVRLSKKNGNTVKWNNSLNEAITIKFDNGSPFPADRNPYSIDAGKSKDSGNITVADGTTWKYTITTASGKVNDPEVIIER